MYEYLNRKPEAGDIIQCQINSTVFTKGKLYISKGVHPNNKHAIAVALDDIGSTTNGLPYTYFTVVKTLSGDQARVGDTCIRVGESLEHSPKGATFIVTHIYDGKIGYKKDHLTYPVNIRVLCLAETKPKAYYKRSGKPWTAEEIAQIPNHWNPKYANYNLQNKWAYPSIEGKNEYFPWNSQRPQTHSLEYNIVVFEDEFHNIETLPITIPIGSYWQEMYTSTSKGPIVEVIKLGTETVHFKDLGTDQSRSKLLRDFLNRFVPISKPDSVSYDVDSRFELPKGYTDIQPTKTIHQINDKLGAPSEPTPTIIKEPTMNFQQLINSIFQEEIQTDYDKKPDYLVVIYNNEGTEIAQATAGSIQSVEDKIQATPKLWGAKAVCYKIDTEVQTQVPVTSTKIKKSK